MKGGHTHSDLDLPKGEHAGSHKRLMKSSKETVEYCDVTTQSSAYELPERFRSQATYADVTQTETDTNLTSNPAYSTNAGR